MKTDLNRISLRIPGKLMSIVDERLQGFLEEEVRMRPHNLTIAIRDAMRNAYLQGFADRERMHAKAPKVTAS